MACGCVDKNDKEHIEYLANRYNKITGESVIITEKNVNGKVEYDFEPVSETIEGNYLKQILPDGREVYTRIKINYDDKSKKK